MPQLPLAASTVLVTANACFFAGVAAAQKPTVHVAMITHFDRPWSMTVAGVSAIQSLASRHPKVRWTHLYNPAAYRQSTPLRALMERLVLDASRAGHEVGLHINMYRSIVESAAVTFRTSPSISCTSDSSGHTVPISSHARREIHKVVERGQAILRSRGLPRLDTFCAGYYTTSRRCAGACDAKKWVPHRSAAYA
ncbi:MAG: hypothetical protein ACE5F1_05970 [Planctomycetota bacterium]